MRENVIIWGGAILMALGFWAAVSVMFIGLHALAYR